MMGGRGHLQRDGRDLRRSCPEPQEGVPERNHRPEHRSGDYHLDRQVGRRRGHRGAWAELRPLLGQPLTELRQPAGPDGPYPEH